jgi:hypothetical protein
MEVRELSGERSDRVFFAEVAAYINQDENNNTVLEAE